MSQSHGIKGGTTDGAFQEQGFLWERAASVGVDFNLFTFKNVYMHKNRYNTWTERIKHNQNASKVKVQLRLMGSHQIKVWT